MDELKLTPHLQVATDFRKGPEALSLRTLTQCAKILRGMAVTPRVVITPEEAEVLIEIGILAGNWEVGDSYYVLQDFHKGVTPLKVFASEK